MAEIENLLGGLLDHLNEVPEPRQSAKIEYPLDEILFLTTLEKTSWNGYGAFAPISMVFHRMTH